MIYNSNEDKFQSIAIGLRNNMNIVLETKFNEASVIDFVKPDFDRSLKLVLLYSFSLPYFLWKSKSHKCA